MTSDSQPAPAGDAAIGARLLECDLQARILWMSEQARVSFGGADHLMDVLRAVAPSGPDGFLRLASTAQFSPVFQRGDTVWISAEFAGRGEATAPQQALTLLDLQSDFLRNYFRLEAAERQLSSRTRDLRRPAALFQVEQERQRLARELHASVGQILAAIRLQLELIASRHSEVSDSVGQSLNRISSLVGDALEHVRSVSRRLHPPDWQRLNLADALRQLWESSGIPQRYEASLDLAPLSAEPALGVKILFYRAAQEALSNLVRHAAASEVQMSLELRGDKLLLTIRDNGAGFDTGRHWSTPGGPATGVGLRSIREQASSLDGVFSVHSGPNGTTLELIAPFRGN